MRIESDAVNHGRNAETGSLKDDRYVRCSNCGFICHLDRDMKASFGSKIGQGRSQAGTQLSVAWNLLNEDCSDISDWTDGDHDTAVSEVDPAGQFRFDTNAGAAGNAYCKRYKDIGSYPNAFTAEIKVYHDAIGTISSVDYFALYCFQGDEGLLVRFASDGFFVLDTEEGSQEVGTNLVKQGGSVEWQTWRFLVTFTGTTGNGTCDVYLNDSTHNWEKVGTAIPCSNKYIDIDGRTYLYQVGYGTDDMVTHIDYVKTATGIYVPGINPSVWIDDTTIYVDDTTGFDSSGTAYIYEAGVIMLPFNYTGITSTTFTGCTGVTRAFLSDNYVRGDIKAKGCPKCGSFTYAEEIG